MKKQNNQARSKEEIEQFEDDPFLKGDHKKDIKNAPNHNFNQEQSVSNIIANPTIFFLVLSIVLIGVLIFKFQQTSLLEQNQRVFLNQQKSNFISQQNAVRNQLQSKRQFLINKRLKFQPMKDKLNNNLPLSPIVKNKQISKLSSLTDKTHNFATPTENKQLFTQTKKTEPNWQKINQNKQQQPMKSQKEEKIQIKLPQLKKQESKPLQSNQSSIKDNINITSEGKQTKLQQKPSEKQQSPISKNLEQKLKQQSKNGTAILTQTKLQTNISEKQIQSAGKQSVNKTDSNATKQQIQKSLKINVSQNNKTVPSNDKRQQVTLKLQSNNQENVHDIKPINDKQKDDKIRNERQISDREKEDKQKIDKQKVQKEKADKEKKDKQKADKQKIEKEKAKAKEPKKNMPKQPKWPKANLTKQQYKFALRRMQLKNLIITESSPLADEQRTYFESKYNLSKYTTELPICIVVPSYNNVVENRHFQNMRSILMQQYTNYHIVFIDDASPDKTGQQIEEFMKNQTIVPPQRYQIIINKQQRLAMPNLRMAAKEYCKPEQIFIIVDGDDQLLGRQVLRLFNAIFQEKKVWFMYTNYLPKDGYVGYSQQIPADIIKENKYRDYKYCTSHLRAYYTQLFRNIKDADLQDSEGRFLRAANDVAILFPIMEQAQNRITYVPQYMYYYNDNTGINNRLIRKQEQLGNEKMLRKRKRYKRLDNLMSPAE